MNDRLEPGMCSLRADAAPFSERALREHPPTAFQELLAAADAAAAADDSDAGAACAAPAAPLSEPEQFLVAILATAGCAVPLPLLRRALSKAWSARHGQPLHHVRAYDRALLGVLCARADLFCAVPSPFAPAPATRNTCWWALARGVAPHVRTLVAPDVLALRLVPVLAPLGGPAHAPLPPPVAVTADDYARARDGPGAAHARQAAKKRPVPSVPLLPPSPPSTTTTGAATTAAQNASLTVVAGGTTAGAGGARSPSPGEGAQETAAAPAGGIAPPSPKRTRQSTRRLNDAAAAAAAGAAAATTTTTTAVAEVRVKEETAAATNEDAGKGGSSSGSSSSSSGSSSSAGGPVRCTFCGAEIRPSFKRYKYRAQGGEGGGAPVERIGGRPCLIGRRTVLASTFVCAECYKRNEQLVRRPEPAAPPLSARRLQGSSGSSSGSTRPAPLRTAEDGEDDSGDNDDEDEEGAMRDDGDADAGKETEEDAAGRDDGDTRAQNNRGEEEDNDRWYYINVFILCF